MAATPHPAPARAGGTRQTPLAYTAALSGLALVVIDAGFVNVALPTIGAALGIPPSQSVRLVSAYQSSLVMGLLPAAALGDSFGYRRVFLSGLVLFAAASLASASAPSLGWLVVARFIQGLGGAAVMALGVALLRQAVPASSMGTAIGRAALTVALCSAAGPPVGAMIVSFTSWRWLFVMHLPLAVAAIAAIRAVPTVPGSGRGIDLVSIALSAGGFGLLVIGAEQIPHRPLAAPLFFLAAGACFLLLVRRELPKATPLVPLDLLRGRSFRLAVVASICCFVGQTSGLLALPFYLQQTLGQTALMTGIYMTPWPVAVALAALLSGRIADRRPTAPLTAAGGAMLGIGLAGAALLPTTAPLSALAALTVVCGLGFGLFQVPNNRNLFLGAPADRSGAAGGMQGTARLIGQTTGAIIVTLLFAAAHGVAGQKLALAAGSAFALAAASVSAWQTLRSRVPAGT